MIVTNPETLGKIRAYFKTAGGKDISFETLEGRISFQKIMYLINQTLHLNFWFNWYVRGPYSPELANAGYRIAQENIPEQSLTSQEKETCKKINAFLKKYDSSEAQELVASLLFLNQELNLKFNPLLVEEFKKRKPQFETPAIQKALEDLKKAKLFN